MLFAALLYFFSPLVAYVTALFNYEKSWAKNVVWGFAAFLGYTLQINLDSMGDMVVYRNKFLEFYNADFSLADLYLNFFSNSGHIEFVENVISVTVSQYTNDYHFLFMAYGLFFGYFFSRNIDYLYRHVKITQRKGSMWLIIGLTFVIPLWNINGFDFWTASQLFLFGVLPLIYEKSYKRFLFIVLAPFTHFSFYLIIGLSMIFLIVRSFKSGIIYVYIGSFFLFGVSASQFSDIASQYLPEIIFRRAEIYLNADLENQSGGTIVGMVTFVYTVAINLVFFTTYKKNKEFIEQDHNLNRFFLYTFYIIGVFNILSVIPSVGRFVMVGQWMLLSALFLLMNKREFGNYKLLGRNISKVSFIFILFWTISVMRYLFPILGIGSILSGPFWVDNFVDQDYVVGNILKFFSN